MSPTYTMSAHLCKSIYASWRETRRSPPSPEKRSMDSDRSDTTALMTRSPSSSSWRSGPK
ncbi:hypothetical protein LZ32DRAFT_658645 [Colletotrichum eremochloae]|nr:hypothetical protein LZ32DRAFT_658736 [Colletotrichum eremochloae]KAK2012785.1 hypothetical protein LZ32DRAFT_658645 [Colletotrichum eremochloae]